MTTSPQKAVGSAAERSVAARFKNGVRVYGYGPVDVVADPFALQVKALKTALSVNAIRGLLDAIPKTDKQLRGAVLISRPGRGQKAKRTIVFDLDEFTEWYG